MSQFVNSQEMARNHPKTFEVPSDAELAEISPGDSVKISTGGERFWVAVTDVGESEIKGTVNNDLLCTDEHGLNYGDAVCFTRNNVYSVMLERGAA